MTKYKALSVMEPNKFSQRHRQAEAKEADRVMWVP